MGYVIHYLVLVLSCILKKLMSESKYVWYTWDDCSLEAGFTLFKNFKHRRRQFGKNNAI